MALINFASFSSFFKKRFSDESALRVTEHAQMSYDSFRVSHLPVEFMVSAVSVLMFTYGGLIEMKSSSC